MEDVRNYLNKSRVFKCPNCGSDITVRDLAGHMKYEISGDMGEETGTEYKYSFTDDVFVRCPDCGKEFKVKGSLWNAPDEDFVYDVFRLFPVE